MTFSFTLMKKREQNEWEDPEVNGKTLSFMAFYIHRNHKAYWGREKGGGRGRLYTCLHCHHQNDSCIKMAATRAILNVSVSGQSDKTVSTDHNF